MRSARAAAKRAKHPSLSSFVRALVLCDGTQLPGLDESTAREVSRLRRDINSGIGANLNQVAHHANAMAKAGRLADAERLLEAVRAAEEKMEAILVKLALILSPQGRP
jgi:thioredoxin-like negative regulator of GroEL